MLQKTNARYRAIENIKTGELKGGFEDDEQNPLEFESRSVTYYDDDVYVCHEETNSSRLKEAMREKVREEENEISNRDNVRLGNDAVLSGVRGN